jgi:hypothetical protein
VLLQERQLLQAGVPGNAGASNHTTRTPHTGTDHAQYCGAQDRTQYCGAQDQHSCLLTYRLSRVPIVLLISVCKLLIM